MKGNPKILETLNDLLADELTAISQYMVHAEMCEDWGYERLHKKTEERAFKEMKHAEALIARIITLEGTPQIDRLNPIHIGQDVPTQFANDLKSEQNALKMYNDAIRQADELADAVTRNLLESNARDEDAHIDWIEEQLDQIEQMGAGIYLSTQARE